MKRRRDLNWIAVSEKVALPYWENEKLNPSDQKCWILFIRC
jgi:hypothetical protein